MTRRPKLVHFDTLPIGARFRAGEHRRTYEKTAPFIAHPGYPADRPANAFNVATNAPARLPWNGLVELLTENTHAR